MEDKYNTEVSNLHIGKTMSFMKIKLMYKTRPKLCIHAICHNATTGLISSWSHS